MRENRGEIQAAREHKLPQLIVIEDIRGELHGHTTWSDGTASVMEMAEAARRRGYSYWGVTDHSVGLGVVQGVDGERLRRQRHEIDAANEHFAARGSTSGCCRAARWRSWPTARWGCPTRC